MKLIKKILLFALLFVSFSNISLVYAIDIEINTGAPNTNLKTGNNQGVNSSVQNNDHLNELGENDASFFNVSVGGEKGFKQTLVNIAKDLKNVFFFIAGLYFLILVLKLIFNDNTEEEVGKFKKGVLWISVGLILTQIAYSFVKILYDNNISEGLAKNFIDDLVYPIIKLLETGASFFFIAIAIYAFYRMITANGEEEKVKEGRMSIFYSIVGFVVIKIARIMIDTIYGRVDCNNHSIGGIIEVNNSNCVIRENLGGAVGLMADIINWVNSIIGIVIIILIIYAGAQILLSGGNEETISKAKRAIFYIILGILLLFINYLILTFFIIPESVI